MDSCEKQEVYGQRNPDRYEAIVCQKDRSHDQLGFTQLARVVIKPHWPQAQENDQTDQSEAEEWVGVVVEVNHEWEE
jgi:hypothetical protein